MEPNSSSAVDGPSTTTAARAASSSAVKNSPDASVRPRTSSQSVLVPTTLVVQLVSLASSDADDVFSAATSPMSGALTDDVERLGVGRGQRGARAEAAAHALGAGAAARPDDEQVAAQLR